MNKLRIFSLVAACSCFSQAYAADLVEVYHQALSSDPVFQQAIARQLSTKTSVPISWAALLPSINAQFVPSLTRSLTSSQYLTDIEAITVASRNTTTRAYSLSLTINQTLFDFAKISALRGSYALAKSADATLNAALQDLMVRVAKAYFDVLRDEDKLQYSEASKLAFKQQLEQVREQYRVGLKTVTEVYTAQASYDSALASYIAAQTNLNNDRESLRAITGQYYPHLARLRDDFPLISPEPQDMESWVNTAQQQNWSIKAQQYTVDSQLQQVRQQFAGHMPTVNVQGQLQRNYLRYVSDSSGLENSDNPGFQTNKSVAVSINFPIFAGGGVIASTNKASYDYQYAQQKLEETIRQTLNRTRQSYLSIMTGITQIKADKQAVKSNISSLKGIRASFRVGTETLVDVLNQQQKVFETQSQYATDRYNFVNNVLALKQAAGTLSFDDLKSVNTWLTDQKQPALIDTGFSRKKKL